MSTPWESPIIRISTGQLNTVNDTVIGGSASIGSRSRYAGQLGKHLWVSPTQIDDLYDPTVGDLFTGRFRYVRLRAADADSPAMEVGQLVFWDTTLTNWWAKYQVTRVEDLSSTDAAVLIAGVYLGGLEGGNYGFIQDLGLCDVLFRASLTTAGAKGSRVYAAGAGAGGDEGRADVLTTDATSIANARYLGIADEAPAASTLSRVLLNPTNALGMGA